MKHSVSRLTAIAAVVLTGGAAQAAPITTSTTNFDTFTNGTVNAQGGWAVGNPAFDANVVDLGGNKALRLSNKVTSGTFGDMPYAPRPGGVPSSGPGPITDPINSQPSFFAGESSTGAAYNKFIGSFDFRSVSTSLDAGARITISPDSGSGGRQGFIALESTAAGVTVQTFDVNSAGGFVAQPTLGTFGFGVWHNLRYEILFNDGAYNDVATIFLDNTLVATINSWERFYTADPAQAALHPNGVPVQTFLFRLSGTAVPNAQGFYVDNVKIQLDRVGTVPEPGSMPLVGFAMAAAGFMGRRRKG